MTLAAIVALALAAQVPASSTPIRDEYSSAAGNCPKCDAGQAMAQAEMRIPHGVYVDVDTPPCGDPRFRPGPLPPDLMTSFAAAYRAQAKGLARTFAVGLSDRWLTAAASGGWPGGSSIDRLLRNSTAQPQIASCVRLVVVVPRSAVIVRSVPTLSCPAGGWCGFDGQPITSPIDADLVAVSVVAKNWSHNREATGRLQVFYTR